MLNPTTDKQDSERLIFKEEVPLRSTVASPFESTDDMVLSGNISSLDKGKIDFRKREPVFLNQGENDLATAFRENQIKNAEKDLRKLPNNPYLLNNLGLAYIGSGDLDKALQIFRKATEVKRDFTTAALNLAHVYLMKRDEESAMKIYNELLRKNKKDIRVLINIGHIYFRNKQIEKAKEIFGKILEQDYKNITSRNSLAIINLVEGNYTGAISEFRKCLHFSINLPPIYNNLGVAYGLVGSYKKAISSFRTALKLYPDYSSATANLAVALKLINNLQDSLELLKNYLNRKENSKIRELLSKFYMENKQYRRALENLKLVLLNAIKSGLPEQEVARLHNNIGVVYHSMQDFENAEKNFLTSLSMSSYSNQISIENTIDLYFYWSKIEKAKKYIDIFHNKFGKCSRYYYYIGFYQFKKEELVDAIESLEKFLKIDKKFPPAYSLLSYICSEYLKDYKRAIEINKEALDNFPGNIGLINDLAYCYLMNNEIDNVNKMLEKVKEINDFLYLIATRGLLKIKESNIKEGSRLYNEAAKLTKNEFLRGQVLQKKNIELAKFHLVKNNKVKAKANLKKAITTKPQNSIYVVQARELLNELV